MRDELIRDEVLAACLEDHHHRRARGEPIALDTYAERLNAEEQAEFQRLLATEDALDALLEPREAALLPRPFGPYTLLRELGRGAMGVVYEAVHRDLGRNVALKVLRAGIDLDADARLRFRREARACAQVRHAHIVEIYEAGEFEGQPYYAMELVPGRTLADAARDGAFRDSRTLFRSMAGVADALAALHAAGIVHRDVKPSNVIVADDGRMLLADFGLARSITAERLTVTGQALGTPLYMSPEQVMGQASEIDGRTDVYALGASLYEVLAGRGPFLADEPMALLRMILRERPDPLADVAPGVPAEACGIVMKALEKRSGDRYQSAAELRDDLLAHAEGRRVEGRPVSEVRHVARRVRPFVPAAAAALVLAAFGVHALATRPARLTVRSVPPAELRIDGASHGTTPLADVEVARGEHRLELVKDGWRMDPLPFTADAGGAPTFQLVMVPENPDDLAALRLLGEQVGLTVAALDSPRTRGESHDVVLPLFPRGKVRRSDLDQVRVDVTDEYEPGGRIVFRRGAQELASLPFEPERPVNELALPAAVRDALSAGDSVAWGYEAPSGARFDATFEVVADDAAAEQLDAVARFCGDRMPRARCHLETQALLDAGLDYAAYRVASAAVHRDPSSARAWAVMETALTALGLADSEPWLEAARGAEAAAQAAAHDRAVKESD